MSEYFLMSGMVVFLFSSSNSRVQSGREFQIQVHDRNQVEMSVSNYGVFGQHGPGVPNCWWPKGTYHNYIYGAGIWFGTIHSATGDTLVTTSYLPASDESEVAPGLSGMSVNHPEAIIYMYPDNWPPPHTTFPMAPQVALSHQDSWSCCNDSDVTYHEPGDTPIGIEIYQTVYVWDMSAIEDIVFLTHEVKNVSGQNLQDCYIGICVDSDVGNELQYHDDQCTAILERPYFFGGSMHIVDDFGYQWDGNDYEQGWGSVGAIGVDLLQTPFDLQVGQDKDGDGIPDQYERDSVYYWGNVPPYKWDVDNDRVPDWRDASENPQLGMTAFKRFTLAVEPIVDPERYLTLAGYDFQTGQYEPYDTIIPVPYDQRFLLSSGPFDLPRDSIITVVCAVVLADFGGDATPAAETCLVSNDYWAQWQYNMNWFLAVEEQNRTVEPTISLVIHPNPVPDKARISFSLPSSDRVSLRLYNVAGQVVNDIMCEFKPAGSYVVYLSTCSLAQGTYFLVLETQQTKSSCLLIVLRK